MGIITRMVRLFKADIHGVMDHLEDKGLLLKQHLREMEEALSQKQAQLTKMKKSRNHLIQEQEKHGKDSEKLEQDIEVAIKGDKDDIARRLIKRNKPLADHLRALDQMIERMDAQIANLEDCLKHQRLSCERIKHRSEEYFLRAEQRMSEENLTFIRASGRFHGPDHDLDYGPDKEEIELELSRRKDALGQGRGS